MRLERLSVSGFGRLAAGLSLEFAPGLNLVLAANEAGKTTLGELIRELLFGFARKSAHTHSRNPWRGGQLGGELAYCLENGRRVELARHLSKQRGQALVSVDGGPAGVFKNGEPGPEHLGVSAGVFDTLALISLDDLQQAFSGAGKQQKDTADNLLAYFFEEAATAGQVANPVPVLAEWQKQREALYSSDRRKGRGDQKLLGELDQAQKDLASALEREEEAARTRERLEELAGQAAGLEKEQTALARARQAAAQGLEMAKARERLAQLEKQTAELAAQGLAEAELEDRAKDLARKAHEAAEQARAHEREASARLEESRALAGGQAPARLVEKLEDLQAREAGLAARREDLEREREKNRLAGQALAQSWGLPLEKLARAPEGLDNQVAQAQANLGQAQELVQEAAHKPGGWPWALAGLLLVAGLGAAAWLLLRDGPWPPADWAILFQNAAWPVWASAGGGLALGAGLGWWQKSRLAAWARQAVLAAEERDKALAALDELVVDWGIAPREEDARRLLQAAMTARDNLDALEALLARGRELERAGRAIGEAFAALGLAGAGGVSQGLGRARQALALSQRAGDLATGAQARGREGQARQAELAGLLAQHGLADMPALLAARARQRQAAGLMAQMEEVRRNLGGALQGPTAQEAQARLGLAEQALAAKAEQLRQAAADLAGLKRDLVHLTSQQSAAAAGARLARLQEERASLAQRHDLLLLAEAVLKRAMESFRLSAQPALMKRAGQYLARATAGRYTSLVSDLFSADRSREPAMTVKQGPGRAEREAVLLSRGTRDQLYLALRLALADESCQGGEPLPLILDDPLVNFDAGRLKETLAMVCELAESRQVLLLTCHQLQAELAAKLGQPRLLGLQAAQS